MNVTLNDAKIKFLKDAKIFFHHDPNQLGIQTGDVISFNADIDIEPYSGFFGGSKKLFSIGSFSYCNSWVGNELFSVGRYSSIAWGLKFLGPRHPLEFVSTSSFIYNGTSNVKKFIIDDSPEYLNFYRSDQKPAPRILNDVWIGQDVTLNDGITISNGAVIAANSVVTKNVGAYEVVGGNPARIIKKRFSDNLIELLLKAEWWKYKFTDFKNLRLDDPLKFIDEFSMIKDSISPYIPVKINLNSSDFLNI
jgi:virginiamycin A acetyltransferase